MNHESAFPASLNDLDNVNAVLNLNNEGDHNVENHPCIQQDNSCPWIEDKFVNSIMVANQLTE